MAHSQQNQLKKLLQSAEARIYSAFSTYLSFDLDKIVIILINNEIDKMGACMTVDKKCVNQNVLSEIKFVSAFQGTSQLSSKESCQKNYVQSNRLAQLKAKLQPLKKGVQQRNKIISMCANQPVNSPRSKGDGKGVKLLLKEQNRILQIKVKKQFQLAKSQILRETMASLSTSENNNNLDFRSQNLQIKCFGCLSQIDTQKITKLILGSKQHNVCRDCATKITFPPGQKENCLVQRKVIKI